MSGLLPLRTYSGAENDLTGRGTTEAGFVDEGLRPAPRQRMPVYAGPSAPAKKYAFHHGTAAERTGRGEGRTTRDAPRRFRRTERSKSVRKIVVRLGRARQ